MLAAAAATSTMAHRVRIRLGLGLGFVDIRVRVSVRVSVVYAMVYNLQLTISILQHAADVVTSLHCYRVSTQCHVPYVVT